MVNDTSYSQINCPPNRKTISDQNNTPDVSGSANAKNNANLVNDRLRLTGAGG